jgi:hypothetical protein
MNMQESLKRYNGPLDLKGLNIIEFWGTSRGFIGEGVYPFLQRSVCPSVIETICPNQDMAQNLGQKALSYHPPHTR